MISFLSFPRTSMPLLKLTMQPQHRSIRMTSRLPCSMPPISPCADHYHPPNALPDYSEIIPRLFIGDLYTAENEHLLRSLGITHVLSVMRGYVAVPSALSIRSFQVDLDDLPFSELAAHLPKTTSFIGDALGDPNSRILVHCMKGVSRSPSVVAAYLMAVYEWSSGRAVQYIKMKRAVEPNSGFLEQLNEYGDKIRRSSGAHMR
jgi:hypothetical protein